MAINVEDFKNKQVAAHEAGSAFLSPEIRDLTDVSLSAVERAVFNAFEKTEHAVAFLNLDHSIRYKNPYMNILLEDIELHSAINYSFIITQLDWEKYDETQKVNSLVCKLSKSEDFPYIQLEIAKEDPIRKKMHDIRAASAPIEDHIKNGDMPSILACQRAVMDIAEASLSPVPKSKNFEISELISAVTSQVRHINPEINLKIDVQEGVLNELNGPSTEINQILVNLLRNAYEHAFVRSDKTDSTITLRIELADIQPKGQIALRFMVEDNGNGIPLNARDTFMLSGVSGESDSPKSDRNYGLGMSSALTEAKKIGAELLLVRTKTIDEVPADQTGTVFSVDVVLNKRKTPPTAVQQQKFQLKSDDHILFVDDNSVLTKTTPRLLNKIGYKNVDIAKSPQEALALILAKKYSAVILDNNFDEVGECKALKKGLEIARIINIAYQGSNYIIISSSATPADEIMKQEWAKVGCDKFLDKPIGLHKLRVVLGEPVDVNVFHPITPEQPRKAAAAAAE